MQRKMRIRLAVLCLALSFAACHADDAERAEAAKKLFADFQTQLQGELQKAIAAGGTKGAIEVCGRVSPEMEARLAAERGVLFRRISDRPRNPDHAADEWERAQLERWRAELAAGDEPAPVHERRSEGLRVMAPIVLRNATCLKCHGAPESIDAATRAAILQRYPADQAVGYKLGDLRGAFSLTYSD